MVYIVTGDIINKTRKESTSTDTRHCLGSAAWFLSHPVVRAVSPESYW